MDSPASLNVNLTEKNSVSIVPSRFTALRKLIYSSDLSFLMEAHSGLSARIVEEVGFQGVWASGLTISSSLGLRDSNEASWTQVLEVLEFINDSISLPILVDGDTGHGNFNNVRRFVRKLCQRNIAGVCIEDKLFPKTNSFIGEAQPLADIDEFCGRIKAGKDSQTHDDFVIVARVEALIAGRGMQEALRRAEAYHASGADAILIHSKQANANEILQFAGEWQRRCPLVIVPTMYYETPTEKYCGSGISTIIWANHLLRASVTAMRDTAAEIEKSKSLVAVERKIASVKELFRLSRNDELEAAEQRYLPQRILPNAVILPPARNRSLSSSENPYLLQIEGRTILDRVVSTLRDTGIHRISVGHRHVIQTAMSSPGKIIGDETSEILGDVASLAYISGNLSGDTVIVSQPILFRRHLLDNLLSHDGDIIVVVDPTKSGDATGERMTNWVLADRPFHAIDFDSSIIRLRKVGTDLTNDEVDGEWTGLIRFSSQGVKWLREELEIIREERILDTADMPLLISRLSSRHEVRILYFEKHWLSYDTLVNISAPQRYEMGEHYDNKCR
ncbi:phosphoenolpyruvate mutase [Rhizobium rhizogenes]|uniref:phosphoenolpyruvate mutase n=1 Tax=Rhizobium rhizogenes TaxID=359 RepID=UPI0015743556|nr:phosphoenolpyruvate mutase [Rhizobium rhizogenes]NTI24875.1 phosphoenolpyruvate mutase [Rhizobium rhizogenes]QTG08594.1 phosphoenolpyruvate mutase [Rhizobium rhizogenes]